MPRLHVSKSRDATFCSFTLLRKTLLYVQNPDLRCRSQCRHQWKGESLQKFGATMEKDGSEYGYLVSISSAYHFQTQKILMKVSYYNGLLIYVVLIARHYMKSSSIKLYLCNSVTWGIYSTDLVTNVLSPKVFS